MKYHPRTSFENNYKSASFIQQMNMMPHWIEMEVHPDYKDTKRDPRKVWLYDCCSGKFAVNFNPKYDASVTYFFELEQDLMMFKLRWE